MAGASAPQSPAASAEAADSPAQLVRQAGLAVAAALDSITLSLASDTDALALLGAVEQLGRRVDAARVSTATDVADRSRSILGHDSLAWKQGASNGIDLITRLTRVSAREANRRVRLGGNVTQRRACTSMLPPYYSTVAAGLTCGDLGVDAAEAIVTALDKVSPSVAPDDLLTAERALVAAATGAVTEETRGLPGEGFAFPADLIRGMAMQWQARLDPDGTAPNEDVAEPRSTVGFGLLRDGLYPLRGAVTAELRGIMNGIFDTYLSAHAAPAFPSVEEQALMDSGELIPGAEAAALSDDRNGGEKRADILRGVFEAAARAPGTPKMGGAAPTVMVHVNAVDLADEHGVGWIDGVEAPVSMRTVNQLICAGGYRKIVFGVNGEVLYLGGKERFFSQAQRRAIAARDGGCIIPGCQVNAAWAEVHHIIPWVNHGPTDINNGVLLCWFHHHSIETSGWLIRMVRGKPEVMAPVCHDPARTWVPGQDHRAHRASGAGVGNRARTRAHPRATDSAH
ncbi:HNH endonuclease signature motif containing protein [Cryobacterium sp. TMT4-10]|uniref:HNH endonuclease signature motif containing protein n=1 Tax=Cryobacterium sp. TMT4-10 TaxID=1259256 RepID=UPI00106AF0B6|nr:HNH endonuclease signature motif containing protein [Cryobacterium sp. TMT4-10]TFD13700.1 HNH endonuclease [Cryobacterium sp. TMT4-10]